MIALLVLHVGVIGHHVLCRYDFLFLRRSYHTRLGGTAKGVQEGVPSVRGPWLARTAGGLEGCRRPNGEVALKEFRGHPS